MRARVLPISLTVSALALAGIALHEGYRTRAGGLELPGLVADCRARIDAIRQWDEMTHMGASDGR